jgi:hypothetical protein
MRDILISMPADVDRGLAARLNEEVATLDPNGLDLDAFALGDDGLRYEALPLRGRLD